MSQYGSEKVQQWSKELKLLSAIATTQPHAAFSAYTHGMISRWSYLTRTVPCIGHHLKVLNDILRSDLIPNLTGRPPPNDAYARTRSLNSCSKGMVMYTYLYCIYAHEEQNSTQEA